MLLPNPKDALHKAQLYRVLSKIYDDRELSGWLAFKGGTCLAMQEKLDRFSVDLDFDFVGEYAQLEKARQKLEDIFLELDLEIKDCSQNIPQYFLKYEAKENERNTLKIDVSFPAVSANTYETKRFEEIDRMIVCQTIETAFANKLVALSDRFEKTGAIAGRDLYDIHYFFLQGFRYNEKVILERRGKEPKIFLPELEGFIEKNITETIISQDLNFLLPPEKFQKIRKTLKSETLMFLRDEIQRIK